MAQEAFEQLTSEWVALSDKITVDEDANYYIQNRGADILLAQEAGEAPTADNVNGTLIKPYEQAKYKANGGDLYLRAYNSNCAVNITSDKTQTGGVVWLKAMTGFQGETVDDTEVLTKTVDGYDLEMSFNSTDSTLTSSVTKDGESAGTSSIWVDVFDGEGNKVDELSFDSVSVEAVSENSFEWYLKDENEENIYYCYMSIEVDVEKVDYNFISGSVIPSDNDSYCELKVKLEA